MKVSLTNLTLVMLIQLFPIISNAKDVMSPYASVGYSHDSNLLRRDANSEQSDDIRRVTAGMKLNWEYKRQQLNIDVSTTDVKYDFFQELDYLGKNLSASWDWRLGKDFSGSLGHTFTRSSASFSDISSIVGNTRDQTNQYARFRWALSPRVKFGLSFSNSELEYLAEEQQAGNSQSYRVAPSLSYTTPKGNKVGLSFSHSKGKYPNRIVSSTSTVDKKYDENSTSLSWNWNASEKSKVNGTIAYVTREHEIASVRDYSAINTRFNYAWSITAKTKLNLSFFKNTQPRDDLNANISENTGFQFSPSWVITHKVSLSGTYSHETRKNKGDTGLNNSVQLKETYDSLGVNLGYRMTKNLSVGASYKHDLRDSNQTNNNYDANVLGINARLSL